MYLLLEIGIVQYLNILIKYGKFVYAPAVQVYWFSNVHPFRILVYHFSANASIDFDQICTIGTTYEGLVRLDFVKGQGHRVGYLMK